MAVCYYEQHQEEEEKMQKLSITKDRKAFMKLSDTPEGNQVIAVTKRNKEVMAIMSWDLYECLLDLDA